jgi:hypothetical protein
MRNKRLIIGIGIAIGLMLCVLLFTFSPNLWQQILTMHGM